MKRKLRLDDLAVESFATTTPAAPARGTVRGHDGTQPPNNWVSCFGGLQCLVERDRCALEQTACRVLLEAKQQLQIRKRILRSALFVEPTHLRGPAHCDHALPRRTLLVGKRTDNQDTYCSLLAQYRKLTQHR